MSIQALRRFLLVANVVSVLVLMLVVITFARSQSQSRPNRKWPSFTIESRRAIDPSTLGQTAHASVPLGAWPRASAIEQSPGGPDAAATRHAELGTVLAAVVVRASPSDDLRTSIAIRRKSGDVRALAVGEALETRPHPRYGSYVRVPAKYRLLACGADARDGAAVHLQFDTDCDGVELLGMDWDCRANSESDELRGIVIAARELEGDVGPHPLR